jgi:hypothetical protein
MTSGFWDTFGNAFAGSAPNIVTTEKMLQVIGDVLELEKLSPLSTKQRLHNYVLRHYTEGGRRIVYHRAKPRKQTMPPVVYKAKFLEAALAKARSLKPLDRRRKLTPDQVNEIRAAKGSVSKSAVNKLKHDAAYWKS